MGLLKETLDFCAVWLQKSSACCSFTSWLNVEKPKSQSCRGPDWSYWALLCVSMWMYNGRGDYPHRSLYLKKIHFWWEKWTDSNSWIRSWWVLHKSQRRFFYVFDFNTYVSPCVRQVLITNLSSTWSTTSARHPSSPPLWMTDPPPWATAPSCCAPSGDPQK